MVQSALIKRNCFILFSPNQGDSGVPLKLTKNVKSIFWWKIYSKYMNLKTRLAGQAKQLASDGYHCIAVELHCMHCLHCMNCVHALRAYVQCMHSCNAGIHCFHAFIALQKTGSKCVITSKKAKWSWEQEEQDQLFLVNWLFLRKPVKMTQFSNEWNLIS